MNYHYFKIIYDWILIFIDVCFLSNSICFVEGVVAEDLLSIIRALSVRYAFTLEAYNKVLSSFGWPSIEMSDKPQLIPLTSNVAKLKGKACSLWVNMRNWPLLIKKFGINPDDEVLVLGLKLHELVERATAHEFEVYEIQLLHECVTDYLDLRMKLRCSYPSQFKKPKPKHHFLR